MSSPNYKNRGQRPQASREIATSRRSLFSRVNGLGAKVGFLGWTLPNFPFSGRGPESPPSPMRSALPFLPKRKGSKRFASLRGLSAKGPTQRSFVKRGLRLWKQQPKQSPPFRKLSPPHQQTAALQLLEVTPIRQIAPLLNQQGSCIYPDRRRNASASLLAG